MLNAATVHTVNTNTNRKDSKFRSVLFRILYTPFSKMATSRFGRLHFDDKCYNLVTF